MILHYKCPNCGSDMSYDAATGKLSCPGCRLELSIEQYEERLNVPERPADDETREYHCENCGAVLVTTKETAATRCSFCGAGVVIAERLAGAFAPAQVIPFSVSREEAEKAFKRWCRNGLLTPSGFMTADRIKSLTGIYVPFWLFDLNSKVQVEAACTRVRTYTQGDYIYTETKHYAAFRDINLDYMKIPVDASTKMDDELMDKLEPFPYDQLKDFKTPYLAGYIAEKYNYTDEQLLPRAKDKINSYVEAYIRSTFSGYSSVVYKDKRVNTRNAMSRYVLLPVWMIRYDYNQKEYIFAMNGQSGKVVGKPPISKGKVAAWFGGIAASTFIALKGVSAMMGGGFW